MGLGGSEGEVTILASWSVSWIPRGQAGRWGGELSPGPTTSGVMEERAGTGATPGCPTCLSTATLLR